MDPAKAKSRAIYKLDGAYYAVALNHKQGRLYAGSTDYAIHVFDVPRDQPPPNGKPSKSEGPKTDAKPADAKAAGGKAKTDAANAKFEPIARWNKHDNYV